MSDYKYLHYHQPYELELYNERTEMYYIMDIYPEIYDDGYKPVLYTYSLSGIISEGETSFVIGERLDGLFDYFTMIDSNTFSIQYGDYYHETNNILEAPFEVIEKLLEWSINVFGIPYVDKILHPTSVIFENENPS